MMLKCNFCGQPEDKVHRLFAGPNVHICNVCVLLCVQISMEVAIPVTETPAAPTPKEG